MALLINPISGRLDLTSSPEKPEFVGESPEITLINTTAEDTAGGRESTITVKGTQSGAERTTLGKIIISHDGAADDQKGKLQAYLNDGNDSGTPTLVLYVDSDGKTGIGIIPLSKFHVNNTIRISRSTDPTLYTLLSNEDGNLDIDVYGSINHVFKQAGTQVVRFTSTGNVLIGAAVAAGTDAVRVFMLSNGTAPTSSPANAVQVWAADTNGTGGKSGVHIRTEDGTSHVIGDKVGIGTTTPNTTLHVAGGQSWNVTTVNAATYDLLVTDHILNVTYTATGAVTSLTLPTAQMTAGRVIVIKDAGGNAGANNITVDTEGAETIDGSATYVMASNYESIQLYSTGSTWHVF